MGLFSKVLHSRPPAYPRKPNGIAGHIATASQSDDQPFDILYRCFTRRENGFLKGPGSVPKR